jgi:hypothetical protein
MIKSFLSARALAGRLLLGGAAGLMAFGVLGAAPAAAAAAPSWSVMHTPDARAQQDQLAEVSCATMKACVAVGHSINGAGASMALARTWNGRVWRAESVGVPRGALSASLDSVSCPSARACIAIGQYSNLSGPSVPLAERWNGRRWAVLPAPGPGMLSAVSCTSAQACTAVGEVGFGGGELAERWDGSTWVVQPTPGLFRGDLAGVSCSSATACTAVGSYLTDDDTHEPLAEAWNGTTWVFQATPTLNDLSSLKGVSCTSASACIAVGRAAVSDPEEGDDTTPLAEAWDGAAWTVLTDPDPGKDGSMAGVSCTSAAACTAVGETTAGALAARWNGTTWAIQPTPKPVASELAGVSCSSARACTMAGGFVHRVRGDLVTLAERWNGTSWIIQRTPGNPAGTPGNSLNAVSCRSARRCIAVGVAGSGVLAERWNGRRWAIQRIHNPAVAVTTHLDAVSCASARRCIAVGSYLDRAGSINFDGSFGLAQRWNGRKWAIQPTPRPAGVTSMEFRGVSCTSARACTAVGDTEASPFGEFRPLAERWNGRKWAIQPTPAQPNPAGGFLRAVSCTSARLCMAVGDNGTGSALAERWNGRKWAIQRSPARSDELKAVSCTSASACTAVGSTRIERWNGRKWASQRNPVKRGSLLGVSCATARECTAVGEGFRGAVVAAHWNGRKWAFQSTPNSRRKSFAGVVCTSARTCTAVGLRTGLFADRTLAERHS